MFSPASVSSSLEQRTDNPSPSFHSHIDDSTPVDTTTHHENSIGNTNTFDVLTAMTQTFPEQVALTDEEIYSFVQATIPELWHECNNMGTDESYDVTTMDSCTGIIAPSGDAAALTDLPDPVATGLPVHLQSSPSLEALPRAAYNSYSLDVPAIVVDNL